MVGVQGEGGGELPDVSDQRGVLQQGRGGREEGEFGDLPVGGGGRGVGGAGALVRRVVLLCPETHHLSRTHTCLHLPSLPGRYYTCLPIDLYYTCTSVDSYQYILMQLSN